MDDSPGCPVATEKDACGTGGQGCLLGRLAGSETDGRQPMAWGHAALLAGITGTLIRLAFPGFNRRDLRTNG